MVRSSSGGKAGTGSLGDWAGMLPLSEMPKPEMSPLLPEALIGEELSDCC